MRIASEGVPLILVVGALAAAVHYGFGGLLAGPLWGLLAVVIYIMREPAREIPSSPLGVVSPVDGRLVGGTETQDPYLERPALSLRLHMAALGPFALRAPVEGKIMERWYLPQAGTQSAA